MTNDFNMPAAPHRLELTDRAHLTVSGVEDVERFDESGVIMTTSAGTLIVTGKVDEVEASLAAVTEYAERVLGFKVCAITKT